ncbi:MAG TPA: extracellular solute-binding protein [Dongiaceae bacterium]
MKKVTQLTSAQETMRAALVSRRNLLKTAAVLGAAGLAAPLYSKSAFSSSGEVNFMGWAGYDFKELFAAFTAKTGIKMNFIEQPDNDTIFAQAKLSLQTGAVDIFEPTVDRVQSYAENDLVQPWDTTKISLDSYEPGLVTGQAGDMAQVNGKRLFVPSVWGTEALVFNTKEAPETYGTASLADLWDPKFEGKVVVRAHSALAALGRVMDAQGKLPRPFMDGYKDDAAMKQIWDVVLAEAIKHKANIAQFWKGENEAQAAFRTNGCVLGLCWDSTGFNMQKEGPYSYIAPKEGAFAWNQGYMLMKNAKNVDQAYEWAKFIASPEGSAANAKAFSANPSGKGAIELADPKVAAFYKAAYPADALSKLWWWPVQSSSFLKLRAEYADKFIAA